MFIDSDVHPEDLDKKPLIEQYDYYFKYYTAKYPKCTVAFQSGEWYEFYGTEDGKIGHPQELAKILLLTLFHKSDYIGVGFQMVYKSRYFPALLEKGWTIVQVDQKFNNVPKGQKAKVPRGVAIIHSPGTIIQEIEEGDNKYIVSIFVEVFKDPDYDPIAVGMSLIDVTTGSSKIYECYNSKDDPKSAFDEITRFIASHNPKEILFHSDFPVKGFTNNYKFEPSFTNLKAQKRLLVKIFPQHGILSIQEYLGIERFTTATVSFVALLQYCLDHNPILLKTLCPPLIYNNTDHLVLSNNCIHQLNILDNTRSRHSSIVELVNFTSTAIGYRLLKDRILFPLTDPIEINQRYSYIEAFWDYKPLQFILSKICDLEKIFRKLEMDKITEGQLALFVSSIFTAQKLASICPENCPPIPKMDKLVDYLTSVVTVSGNFFNETTYPRLQELTKTKDNLVKSFTSIKANLEQILGVELESTLSTEEGVKIKMTNAKYKIVADRVIILGETKTYKWITTVKGKKLSKEYIQVLKDWQEEWNNTMENFKEGLRGFRKTVKKIAHFVAEIDVYVSSARCAQEYNYCKPQVVTNEKSWIKSKAIRHPIIERITDSIYTTHDITFSSKMTGMLLYGYNASGKSSLMKAIGINLVLAQAGLYTAANSFKFSPYTILQTRITANDNIHKGLSSFAVEMAELRGILSRSNSSTLVLGDEICRGTESISGTALVTAGIQELVEKESHFLFATHLHQLAELEEIKSISTLGIFHLHVEKDSTGVLDYKRDLLPGPGDSLYGIEVARAMKLPRGFIDRALAMRTKLVGQERRCRYNSDMWLDRCGVCNAKATEVHHIRFQSEADDKGFIGHFHKNNLRNLVGLCEGCHKKIHKGLLSIDKWKETSDGFKLVWK